VELLVVIGIIALLIAMLLPALNKVRAQARVTQCMSNQRQIAIAIRMFANEREDRAPGNNFFTFARSSGQAQDGAGLQQMFPTGANINFLPGGSSPTPDSILFRLGYLKSKEVWKCPETTPEEGGNFNRSRYGADFGEVGYYGFNLVYFGESRYNATSSGKRLESARMVNNFLLPGVPAGPARKMTKVTGGGSETLMMADRMEQLYFYFSPSGAAPSREISGPQAVHQKRTRAVCIYMDGHGEVQRVTGANGLGDGRVPSRNDPY